MKEKAIEYLKQYFGYDEFRPMQYEAIEQVMNGKDVLLVMPTGGGKSLCFQLPPLLMKKTAIVISPLISLMKDQVDSLKLNGIKAASINSALNYQENKRILNAGKENGLNLLYLSPERLLSDFSIITKLDVGLFAIDEAHCISSWGHDFRPEYTRLKKIKELYPEIPVIALTATADKITRKDISIQLGLQNPETFVASFNRPNLSLNVLSGFSAKEKKKDIVRFILAHPGQSGIIYCLSRKETESMADALKEGGIPCAYYHAGMTPELRRSVQEDFSHNRTRVICATIAFGLGIHKPDVRWVIHNNLPKNLESYYQEIGRAGRDGLPAETLLYYTTGDVFRLRSFAQDSGQVELNIEKLKRIQQYADADVCRRRILISYFGEPYQENCGNCDICRNPREHIDGREIAQKAISALIRMGEKSGSLMLIDVLRGSRKTEILEKRFHLLKSYGIGKSITYHDWQAYILQMLNLGIFEIAYDEGFSLKVTPYGKDIVYGRAGLLLVKPDPHKEIFNLDDPFEEERDEFELLSRAALESMRQRIADDEHMPAYAVFNDQTLEELVVQRPRNYHDLLRVSGISRMKAEKYGESILEAFIGKRRHHRVKGETYMQTLALLNLGNSLEVTAGKRNLKPATIANHIAHLIRNGHKIEISAHVSKENLERVSEILEKLGEKAGIRDVLNELNNEIPGYLVEIAIAWIQIHKPKVYKNEPVQ